MCIVFTKANNDGGERVFVLAANRDEFLARPTAPLAWNEAASPSTSEHARTGSGVQVLSGLDLQSGGTWIGVSSDARRLRVAALTNYTEAVDKDAPPKPSRGQLVHDFLVSRDDIASFVERVDAEKERYAGFNLLLVTVDIHDDQARVRAGYVTNRNGRKGDANVDASSSAAVVSNSTLNDESWPKLANGKRAFTNIIASDHSLSDDQLAESLFDMLSKSSTDAVRDRSRLRQTVLVRPVFFDPLAPLPSAPPPSQQSYTSSESPRKPGDIGPFEQNEGQGNGHWYATRVQTIIIVTREADKLRVDMRERDVYKLGDDGKKPVYSGERRKFTFTLR